MHSVDQLVPQQRTSTQALIRHVRGCVLAILRMCCTSLTLPRTSHHSQSTCPGVTSVRATSGVNHSLEMQRLKGGNSHPIVATLAVDIAHPRLPCACSCFQLLVRPQLLHLSVPASTALPHPSCPSAADLVKCNSIALTSHACSTSLSQNHLCFCTITSIRGRHQHRPSHTHCAVDGQHHGRAYVRRLPLCAQVTHEQRDQVKYLSRSTGKGQENGLLAIRCGRADSWAARQLTAHAGHCRVLTYGTVCLKPPQYGQKAQRNAFCALTGRLDSCSSGKAGSNASHPLLSLCSCPHPCPCL